MQCFNFNNSLKLLFNLKILKIYAYFFILIFLIPSCSERIRPYIIQNTTITEHFSGLECDKKFEINFFEDKKISVGAEQFDSYRNLIENKRVALVVNQTSVVNDKHLADFLIENGINIIKIFVPEHGFRGDIDRGTEFNNSTDERTGLPIIALYGKNKKPKKEQLEDIDIVIFDIQDVGVRFFTYISTMHYVMEACAENSKKFIVLDRPNPLGDYVDGPVLQAEYKSFVGMHPIPVVHGLTVAELALMINGERWLSGGLTCDLHVVKVFNYKHADKWHLEIKPSPNLTTDIAVRLYPSLCFFEATEISIGRGTDFPFEIIGYSEEGFGEYSFMPVDKPGMQINPIHENKMCWGIDLRKSPDDIKFSLKYILNFSEKFDRKSDFITNPKWFNLLAGNDKLYKQIILGMSEEQIKETWSKDLTAYKQIRKKYLLYIDNE